MRQLEGGAASGMIARNSATFFRAAITALGLFAAAVGPAGADGISAYRLGPEDHLMLKVWDLRNGDPYQWVALSGEFVVGADGAVSLPLAGEVRASGETTAELAAAIGVALQSKVGLSSRPDASVQVIKYRPLYVMGAVQRPGRYDYQPGLTVLQAVSTAEGFVRVNGSDLNNVQRQAIEGRGDLKVFLAERSALLARQARLLAEIADAPKVDFPPELRSAVGTALVAQAMHEEALLFATRRESLQAQLVAIDQSKTVLHSTLSALAEKDASLSHQLDLTRKDLEQVSGLVAKGVAVMPRQLAAEQSVASFEGGKLDVQLATLKTQQDLSQADRDIIDLKAKFRTGALSEASDIRAKLDANAQRISSVQALVRQAEDAAPGLTQAGVELTPVYTISRASDGTTVTATERDEVEPGDVLRVYLPAQSPDQAAGAPPIADGQTASRTSN